MKGVLFDWDGTLLDSEALIVKVWQHSAKIIGRTFDEERFKELIGLLARDIVISLFPEEDFERIDQVLKVRHKYYEDFYPAAQPFPDAQEILGYLSVHSYKIGIISSNHSGRIMEKLRELDWVSYFDCVIGEDISSQGKPSPLIVLEAAKRLDLRPEECYVVGDSQYDIEAGKNACASTILVCRQLTKQKEMSKWNPDYIVSNLLEIRQILESSHRGGPDQ